MTPLASPPTGKLEVEYFAWEVHRPIIRVAAAAHQPNTFNASATTGRFRPLYALDGTVIPTLYGANHVDGALGESVFHDVPQGVRRWVIPRSSLYARVRAMLIPQRALQLVDLTGWAHKALRIPGRALVDCNPSEYPITASWAARFHRLPEYPDGLYWRSRQYDKSFALMLFGDRVSDQELNVILDETVGLWQGPGFDEVLAAAERAGVTIAR